MPRFFLTSRLDSFHLPWSTSCFFSCIFLPLEGATSHLGQQTASLAFFRFHGWASSPSTTRKQHLPTYIYCITADQYQYQSCNSHLTYVSLYLVFICDLRREEMLLLLLLLLLLVYFSSTSFAFCLILFFSA